MSFTKITFTIIFIAVQIILTSTAAFANTDSGNIAGTVWMDENNNGVQELNEMGAEEMLIVYVQAEGSDVIEGNVVENGTFAFNKIGYGRYNIWSEDMSGNATAIQVIELSEVSGTAVVSLGMTPAAQSFNVFLPMVSN